jgi:hypothetical protein
MPGLRGRAWALALVLLAAACGQINALKVRAPEPGTRQGEWALVRNAATRRALLYDRFQHRATVTATYLGAKERDAKVRRLAEWLGWTEQERLAAARAEQAEAAKYDDFLVALYTADRKSNDLDARSSVWRISLAAAPDQELVTRDARIQDVNATLKGLFPYLSPFDSVYRVRFNRRAGGTLEGRAFQLNLASAIGKLELTFGDGAVGPDRPEAASAE